MPEAKFPIETRAHPKSAHQWYLTEEGINQLCDDLPGKPVQLNYQGQPVGTVLGVERVEDGKVEATIDVVDPQVAKILEAKTIGPALFNPDSAPQLPAGQYPIGRDWRVKGLGAVDPAPPEEPTVIAEESRATSS